MPVSLALHDVRVRYGPVEALHGVDLAFPGGAVTALLGRNGAGRSTLLRTLAGVLHPASGRIEWDGRDVTRWTASERARDGLALIPDGHGVFAGLSVRDNLRVFAGNDTVEPALDAFPVLRKRLGQHAGTLSGGEQQMLAVSRALLRPSRVLLLDELSQGLAPASLPSSTTLSPNSPPDKGPWCWSSSTPGRPCAAPTSRTSCAAAASRSPANPANSSPTATPPSSTDPQALAAVVVGAYVYPRAA